MREPIAAEALASRLRKAAAEGLGLEDCKIVSPNRKGGYLLGSNFDRSVWYPMRKAAGVPNIAKGDA